MITHNLASLKAWFAWAKLYVNGKNGIENITENIKVIIKASDYKVSYYE